MTLLLPAHSVTTLDTVWHTDLITLCNGLGDASIDMILTDVPYGTTACAWDEVIPFEPMWAAFKRVIKPRGAIVMTASQPFTSALVMSNPEMFKYTWVWDKVSKGDIFNAKNKPLKCHEDVLIFSLGTTANGSQNRMCYFPQDTGAGKRKTTQVKKYHGAFFDSRKSHPSKYNCSGSDYPSSILRFSNADRSEPLHPTQKPVALFEYLIRTYTRVGDVVLDPCVGSGTTAIAARQCGRHYIVGDSSAQYVEVARRRLAQDYTLPMFESMGVAV